MIIFLNICIFLEIVFILIILFEFLQLLIFRFDKFTLTLFFYCFFRILLFHIITIFILKGLLLLFFLKTVIISTISNTIFLILENLLTATFILTVFIKLKLFHFIGFIFNIFSFDCLIFHICLGIPFPKYPFSITIDTTFLITFPFSPLPLFLKLTNFKKLTRLKCRPYKLPLI